MVPDAARSLVPHDFPDLARWHPQPLASGRDNTAIVFGAPRATADQPPIVFRFPRRAIALPGIRREIAWLPRLAPRLPLPVPVPRWCGEWPARDAAWPYWGAELLPGEELALAAAPQAELDPLAASLGAERGPWPSS